MNNILNKSLIIPVVISLRYIIRIEITWTEGIDCFFKVLNIDCQIVFQEDFSALYQYCLKNFSVEAAP